jgi:hypothetical protein
MAKRRVRAPQPGHPAHGVEDLTQIVSTLTTIFAQKGETRGHQGPMFIGSIRGVRLTKPISTFPTLTRDLCQFITCTKNTKTNITPYPPSRRQMAVKDGYKLQRQPERL